MTNKVEIVAHSKTPYGEEAISVLVTFPRIILAEINTHRMLSKNTSSSRAIPFLKMVEAVTENPFIPIAWQKHHPGMQGTEYLDSTQKYELTTFISSLIETLNIYAKDTKEYKKLKKEIEEKVEIIERLLTQYKYQTRTLPEWWLLARDKSIEAASLLYVFGVTKQLCNRLLEPFMWTTMLITGSREGWDNFFKLRCPQYSNNSLLQKVYKTNGIDSYYKSKKELIKDLDLGGFNSTPVRNLSELDWLNANKGQAEIHIMDLAEKIFDAVDESEPTMLAPGEWHIPMKDKIDLKEIEKSIVFEPLSSRGSDFGNDILNAEITKRNMSKIIENKVKTSVSMAARTSYTVFDAKDTPIGKHIELHDNLLKQDPPHSSPTEHCWRCMTAEEYYSFVKGEVAIGDEDESYVTLEANKKVNNKIFGWCYNAKGFIPYRYFIDNNINAFR